MLTTLVTTRHADLHADALCGKDDLAGTAGQAAARGRVQPHADDLPRRCIGRRQEPGGSADQLLALE